eukprot:CAMPEP_0178381446 /NCGR_PEP_ID=MMETSP0689_2-20121128/5986_1 /TAXON_ID=160604 /ORGANISM="Amphidinium massartii, Strain CS-259" /LENGTH=638 /DNA_ID=CAMNT_0020001627 /DNA_START=1 /DNA_END=1917 /DNA_ORIENTATION=-
MDPLLPTLEPQQDEERGGTTKKAGQERAWQGLVDDVLHWMREWWRITADSGYLGSRISRRPAWKIVVPLSSIVIFTIDSIGVVSGSVGRGWWLIADALIVGVSVAVTNTRFAINIGTVKPDVVLGLTISIAGFLMEASESSNEHTCSALGLMDTSFYIMLMLCLGFHSLVATMFWVMCALTCLLAREGLLVFIITTVVWLACLCLEFTLASMHHNWMEELSCNQRLLDCTTDGFGVVSFVDGVVLESSPKMAETLGSHDIIGRPFASLVDCSDHAALVALLGMAGRGVPPAPVLLTCVSEATQQHIDVRLVPYRLKGSQLGICIQKLGEPRSFARRSEIATAADPTASVHHVQIQDQLLVQEQPLQEHGRSGLDEQHDLHLAAATVAAPPASTSSAGDHAEVPDDQGLDLPGSRSGRSRGSLSLSSFSRSAPSSSQHGARKKKKKVETNTVSVQATRAERDGLPPAPVVVDPVPPRAVRKRRVARTSKRSFVVEGQAKLSHFQPTPCSTRGNAFAHLVKSCNIDGQGCCERHVAWMGFHALLSEELLAPCGPWPLCKDWQCPECRALNDFRRDDDEDDDEKYTEQVCGVCNDLVVPILPQVALLAGNEIMDASELLTTSTSESDSAATDSSASVGSLM